MLTMILSNTPWVQPYRKTTGQMCSCIGPNNYKCKIIHASWHSICVKMFFSFLYTGLKILVQSSAFKYVKKNPYGKNKNRKK